MWRAKSRFEDVQALAACPEDMSKYGCFPKDPDLADVLHSGPAVAAALQLQHAFEMELSKEDCIQMIEDYAVWNGDEGLTQQIMREACNLPPIDKRVIGSKAEGIVRVDTDDDAGTSAHDGDKGVAERHEGQRRTKH